MALLEKYLSRNWLCCFFIGIFTFLLWGQTIGYGFVWDDDILVVRNQSIRSLRNFPDFFTKVEAQSQVSAPSFRPIRTTYYAALYALEGKETPTPALYHFSNVLWHAAAAMLLFQVTLLLWGRWLGAASTVARGAALLTALGFAANPANAEAVCWVKCLDDLMAGVFVLASAWWLLRWKAGWGALAVSWLWFLLACFSYESAVPFAAAAFLLFRLFHGLSWRKCLERTVPYLVVAAFFVGWRQMVIGRASQCAPISGSYGQTLIDMFPVGPEYLRLLCGIPPFCVDYDFMVDEPPHPLISTAVMGGMLLILLAAGMAVWFGKRSLRGKTGATESRDGGGAAAAIFFGLTWVGLFLLPVSNLVPMMQYMAERFLYLPMMGFLLAPGGVFLKLARPRWAALAAAGVVVAWAGVSLERMPIWKDGLTLFVGTELQHPGIRRVQQNALSAIYALPQMEPLFPDYAKTGSLRMAETLTPSQAAAIAATLQQARSLYPTNATLTTDLAFVKAKSGAWDVAIALAKLATQQKPDSAECWLNLANMLAASGHPAEAGAPCAEALRLKPDFAEAKLLQARIESQLKRGPVPAGSDGTAVHP